MDHIVFISYAKEDGELATKLYRDLAAEGFRPWIDSEKLLPGVEWKPAIRRAIREARFVLVLLSHHSVTKRGYVQKEIREALEVLDEFPESAVFMIPARVEPCDIINSHERLADLHWVDLFPSYDEGLAKIVMTLRSAEEQETGKRRIFSDSPRASAPLRTEILKVQLEELRALLQFLARKDELDLREEIGFGELVAANAVRLHDRFFRDVYGVTVNEDERPYSGEKCPASVVHEDFLLPCTEIEGAFFSGQRLIVMSPRPGPSEDARVWWAGFRLDELFLPTKLINFTERLFGDMSSPFLPAPVVQRMDELLKVIDENRDTLFDMLSSVGQTLPARFSGSSPPKTITVDWVKDLYYSKFIALRPRVDAVVQTIREYLAQDLLFKP